MSKRLVGIGLCLMLGAGSVWSQTEEETLRLEKAGFHKAAEGVVKRVSAWNNGWRVDLSFQAAFILNDSASVVLSKDGKWFTTTGEEGNLATLRECKDFAELIGAVDFKSLPAAPEGWNLRELANFPVMPVRMIANGDKELIVLGRSGDIWRVDVSTGEKKLWITPGDYQGYEGEVGDCLGLAFDREGRLYVACNMSDRSARPRAHLAVIFRTEGDPRTSKHVLRPWLRAVYPLGISAFKHGLAHVAMGPDGKIYVNSGSRTNQGETGGGGNDSTEREVPLTSCIWRLDPSEERPQVEVFADGLRNAYGFCWDESGRMFATDNGPEMDAPEELNYLQEGKHYGFPYEFSNWTYTDPEQPPKPPGLVTIQPILNVGPAAGGSPEKPLATFDPHSCPAGIIYLGKQFPESVRGGFFVVRFGSLKPARSHAGFDLLYLKLDEADPNQFKVHVSTFVAPLGRPLDIAKNDAGDVFVCEALRETTNSADGLDSPPGRVLLLRPAP